MLAYEVKELVDSNLRKFCKYIAKVRKQDEDFVMLVSGQTRSGKSTLAIEIAMLIDPDFNIEKNILFDIKELGKRIFDEKGKEYILDESIFDAFSRDAMSSMNKWLIKVLTACAERNHIIIMIIPKVKWLDKPVRERISFMFYTIKHSEAFTKLMTGQILTHLRTLNIPSMHGWANLHSYPHPSM